MTFDDFRASSMVQSAVLYKILIIGEATKRLSVGFRANHPSIPWAEMAGARDRLIHGYDRVRVELVWAMVQEHIPRLVRELAPILPQHFDE